MKGKEEFLMKRTCLVVNTYNVTVASRKSIIYSDITIAEYFRDTAYEIS